MNLETVTNLPRALWNIRQWLLLVSAVFALVLLAYGNSLSGELVFDDGAFLVDNPNLTEQHHLSYFFKGNVWSYSHNSEFHAPTRYRPLFFLSLWSINKLWPGSTLALHLFSLGLHMTVALLLLVALPRFLPGVSPLAAGFGACLFTVHPANVGAVAWISAFVHPMAATFLLASFLFHDCCEGKRKPITLVAASLFFVLALLTGEMAVGFPVFIFLYEWIQQGRPRFAPALPYLAVLVIYMIVRTIALGETTPIAFLDPAPWALLPAFLSEYLRYLVLPWPQPVYLSMPGNWGVSIVSILSAVVLTSSFIFVMAVQKNSRKGLLIAAAWIIAALMPPLLAVFSPQAVFALRSLYLPSIGIAILAAWLIYSSPVWQNKLGKLAMVAVLLLGLGTTIQINNGWHDDGQVYRRIIANNPSHFAGHLGLAEYLAREGRIAEAVTAYEKSIALADVNARAEPMMRLASLAARRGDTVRAIHLYKKSIEIAGPKLKTGLLMSLGLLLGQSGDSTNSLDLFRQVTNLDPGNSAAWNGIGNSLWMQGELNDAAVAYRKAIIADPGNWQACSNLVLVLEKMGKVEEAARYAECAVEPK